MQLELTKQDLERLLELAYMGDWMVNGLHADEDRVSEHDAVLQKIYALAEENGLGWLIETRGETGDLAPSAAFRDRMDLAGHVSHYDEDVFWDELALRLAERDLRDELGKGFDVLPREERERRVDEIAEGYDKEFDKNGVDRLRFTGREKLRRRRDSISERLKKLFEDEDKDA